MYHPSAIEEYHFYFQIINEFNVKISIICTLKFSYYNDPLHNRADLQKKLIKRDY